MALLTLFAVVRCSPGIDGERFLCAESADCAEGTRCHEGECLSAEELSPLEEEAGPGGGDGGSDAGEEPPLDAGPVCLPAPAGESCTDGLDNTCDGTVDCADPTCDAKSCGANGRVCQASQCQCSGNGGAAQATESSCTDGFDNDCDGVFDCADPDCAACASGSVCQAGSCVAVTYTTGASTEPFVDACSLPGMSRHLPSVDDAAKQLTLPFPFRFYGEEKTQYFISDNGLIGFGALSSQYDLPCLPSTGSPRPAINVFGDDLATRADGICTAVTGTAPDRKLVVTWKNMDHRNNVGASLTFTAFLSESTHAIDIVFQTMTGNGSTSAATGGGAIIGVQNGAASLATVHACNVTGSASGGTKVRFVPQPSP